MNGPIFRAHRAHKATGQILELFELLVADVVEFKELVCFFDDFFGVHAGFDDASEAFSGFLFHGFLLGV